MNFIVLHGLGGCLDYELWTQIISLAESIDIKVVLVDSDFSSLCFCTLSSRIILFELNPFISYKGIESKLFNKSNMTHFPAPTRMLKSDIANSAFAKMATRLPLGTISQSKIDKILRELMLKFRNDTDSLNRCLLNIAYDIPHSCIDFALYTILQEQADASYYLRSTGIYPDLKTLHKFSKWENSGLRKPVPILITDHNLTLDLQSISTCANDIIVPTKVNLNSLPYKKEFTHKINEHYKNRKSAICANIDKYASKIKSVASLKREYSRLCLSDCSNLENFLDGSFVYLLHREPEASTCPESLPFLDQIDSITMIRRNLPSNIRLLVKEHPQTFTDWETLYWPHIRNLAAWRPEEFYDQICKLPNTYLLPMSQNIASILNMKPICLGTLTGSVYVEAARERVPCLSLKDASYAFLPFIGNINSTDIEDEIKNIKSLYNEEQSKLLEIIEQELTKYTISVSLRVSSCADELPGNLSRVSRINNFILLLKRLMHNDLKEYFL